MSIGRTIIKYLYNINFIKLIYFMIIKKIFIIFLFIIIPFNLNAVEEKQYKDNEKRNVLLDVSGIAAKFMLIHNTKII